MHSKKSAPYCRKNLLQQADELPYVVPEIANPGHNRIQHGEIRLAYERKEKLLLEYVDAEQKLSQRLVWPLAMVFWGEVWVLLAWCEKRHDYRNFRFDRIQSTKRSGEHFNLSDGLSWQHYLDTVLAHKTVSASESA